MVRRLRSAALSSAFLATSWILADPGTASAQQVAPPPPPAVAAPPPPPPAAEPPPGYMFDMSSMGKAWGDMLKGYGIYLNGGFETNFFGYIGGRKNGTEGQGEDTLGADLDMNRILGIPGAAIHISTDDRWGANPARFVGGGIFSTANYGPQDQYRLAELSWDQDLANDHIRILVGRIADNIDFSGSELYCKYLFSICGNLYNAWYFNNANPSYPVATWAGRVTIKPTLETYLRFGAYQETSVQAASGSGITGGRFWESFDFGHNTGVFIPAEIGYKSNFDQDPFPRGAYLGGWYDSAKYTDPFGHAQQGRSGVYFAVQQMIYRPNMASHRGITVFGGAEFDTAGAGPVAMDVSGGLSWLGPFVGRPADTLNLGGELWQFNRNWTKAYQFGCAADAAFFPGIPVTNTAGRLAACSPFSRGEVQLEVNYTYALAPGISLIPVVAYQINPDMGLGFPGLSYPPTTTVTKVHNAWILGAQLAIGLNGAFGLPSFVRTN